MVRLRPQHSARSSRKQSTNWLNRSTSSRRPNKSEDYTPDCMGGRNYTTNSTGGRNYTTNSMGGRSSFRSGSSSFGLMPTVFIVCVVITLWSLLLSWPYLDGLQPYCALSLFLPLPVSPCLCLSVC